MPKRINKIAFFNQDTNYVIKDKRKLVEWIKVTLHKELQPTNYINIILTSDKELLKLNTQYLNHTYFTDVITFQYSYNPIEGDIYISIDTVKDNAKSLNLLVKTELHRVIIHGVLHLCGYEDKTKKVKQLMTQKENDYLKLLK